MKEELEQKAEEMIINFFCGVRQADYTHKETVRLMVKFAGEVTKELQKKLEFARGEVLRLNKRIEELLTEKDKRIADLEAENKEMTLKIDRLESYCDAYNYSQRTYQEEIKELKAENEQIKNSDTLCKLIGEQKRKITELEQQIEKMKNCKNCANYMISGKCPSFFRTGWCKNWEMTRSKK